MIIEPFLFPLLFLIGASSITALTKSLEILGKIQSKKEFKKKPHFFFGYSLIKKLFTEDPWDNFFYLLSFSKHLLRLLYSTTFFLSLLTTFYKALPPPFLNLLACIGIVAAFGLSFDFFFRFVAGLSPSLFLRLVTPITTFFLLIFSPVTFLLLKLQKLLFHPKEGRTFRFSRARIKDQILEVAHESELSIYLDPFDRRIIGAVASMRDRIVREIMVPRIDIFTLSVDQTIHEAARKFTTEGYSRIPVYKESVDAIIGVLLYKDVMEYYVKSVEKKDPSLLETPLEKLVKPILYAPETKKISALLQEFRSKQIHLAIVVDEYGGTEGIVTIEDILEELVGEIADEHDVIEEEKLYAPHPDGGYTVDGKMTIVDIEKELHIVIPPSPEYDTIGGYVFHRAGTIPQTGWKIHNDHFDLEVIRSSERVVDEVRIIPCEV